MGSPSFGGTAIFQRLVGLIGSAVAVVAAAGFAFTYALDVQRDYNAFLDKALYENGVLINYIYTSKFGRSADRASEFRVAIDDGVPESYARHIRLAYEFLAEVSGRSVTFDVVSNDVFDRSDRYVYVGKVANDADPHAQSNPFVDRLSSSLEKLYPNKSHDLFWDYQNASLGQFYGTPLFFNSEFGSIDYNAVINGREKHQLKNADIEKNAIYINVPTPEGFSDQDVNEYTNYVILQEIYQEYNLASDVSDGSYRLKSILYDHDDALDEITGSERIRIAKDNASRGLCPYDVILVSQLYHSEDGNSPRFLGVVGFSYMYMKAYWYRMTYPSVLFDSRCW